MVKMLKPLDGELALVIDGAILDRLHIDAQTPLDVREVEGRLVVEPTRDPIRDEEFQRALTKVNEQFGNALRRLAE